MYRLLRSILFLADAERMHYFAMNALRLLLRIPAVPSLIKVKVQAPVTAFGVTFRNPVGLGAGFDKNARYLKELDLLGFGCVEIGTVTPAAQEGNSKPRLFRLPKDKALINRMGFNNDGADAIALRLQKWRQQPSSLRIGINIGKNKLTPNEFAWKDYLLCMKKLYPYADYIAVNVSSPNTPGLRDLQEVSLLSTLLEKLITFRNNEPEKKPLLLKLSPDLNEDTLMDIVDLCIALGVDGLILSNTTISREMLTSDNKKITAIGAGGMSGMPLFEQSTNLLKKVNSQIGNRLPIIASGGIFTKAQMEEKIKCGACMVQVWTGFVYEGPFIVKKLLQ